MSREVEHYRREFPTRHPLTPQKHQAETLPGVTPPRNHQEVWLLLAWVSRFLPPPHFIIFKPVCPKQDLKYLPSTSGHAISKAAIMALPRQPARGQEYLPLSPAHIAGARGGGDKKGTPEDQVARLQSAYLGKTPIDLNGQQRWKLTLNGVWQGRDFRIWPIEIRDGNSLSEHPVHTA